MAQVRLNNLDIEKIQALVKEMQENPQLYQDMANSGWNTRVQWQGGFQHSVFARELAPTTFDEPAEVAGGDRGLSPHEAVMSASALALPPASSPKPPPAASKSTPSKSKSTASSTSPSSSA